MNHRQDQQPTPFNTTASNILQDSHLDCNLVIRDSGSTLTTVRQNIILCHIGPILHPWYIKLNRLQRSSQKRQTSKIGTKENVAVFACNCYYEYFSILCITNATATASRLSLGSPTQWVPASVYSGLKWIRCEPDHSRPSGAGVSTRNNFTLTFLAENYFILCNSIIVIWSALQQRAYTYDEYTWGQTRRSTQKNKGDIWKVCVQPSNSYCTPPPHTHTHIFILLSAILV
jgi:hypothetical protein